MRVFFFCAFPLPLSGFPPFFLLLNVGRKDVWKRKKEKQKKNTVTDRVFIHNCFLSLRGHVRSIFFFVLLLLRVCYLSLPVEERSHDDRKDEHTCTSFSEVDKPVGFLFGPHLSDATHSSRPSLPSICTSTSSAFSPSRLLFYSSTCNAHANPRTASRAMLSAHFASSLSLVSPACYTTTVTVTVVAKSAHRQQRRVHQ